jgi:alkanesulfonate monooxygenase SsuD/methylene tetrahydromethanopterin reductase-like flavin-dependent oxidoreductase (luciferase family)
VPVDLGIYVPQIALSYDDLLVRARHCERLGFRSFWLFDHLYGPELPGLPAFEGWTLATSLLAHTETLRVGHLVLCNGFRHPAVLARMASTLDVISGGRLELGLGTGSYQREHVEAGLHWGTAAERSDLLRESLEVITRMLGPGPTTWSGRHFAVQDLPNLPLPSPRPRLLLGGVGPRYTLPLVARYADAWNVPTYGVARRAEAAAALERECEQIGRDPAEIGRSLQLVMAVAADEASLPAVRALAERRYPGSAFALHDGGLVGTAEQVTERLRAYIGEGWTEFALFLHDRGSVDTLELIAAEVAPYLET